MASDTFNIDPSVISAVSDNIRIVNESLKESASEAKNFNSNILDAAETMVNMGTNASIMYTSFSDLSTILKDMTGSLNEVNDVLNNCRVNLGKQLGQVTTLTNGYRQLLIQARSYATQLGSISRIQQANRQQMSVGGGGGGAAGGGAGNNINNVRTQKQAIDLWKKQGTILATYATSLLGIQFSIGGIIAALVEAYDKTRKLTGISQIVNAQFKEGGRDVKAIANATYALRSAFKLSIDEAGKYMKQLSRLGLEKDQIQKFSKELVATEILYGQSIDDQVESMQNLINNFGLVSKEALNYNSLIRQTAIEMPNMSMSSVVDEIDELIQNQKMYNTDLLSTIGLYGILMRQDMSKKLGFDTLPRDFRKALVTGISGINKNMSDEWKAALGMFGGAGKTPAAAILGFEQMDDAKKLVTILQFATKKTGGDGGLLGATPERIIMIRKLLEDMGIWSKEITQKVVAEMKPGKPLDVNQIAKVISGAQAEQKSQAARLRQQETKRNDDIAATKNATNNLQNSGEKIKQYIEDLLLKVMPEILKYLEGLYEIVQSWFNSTKVGKEFMQGRAVDYLQGKKREEANIITGKLDIQTVKHPELLKSLRREAKEKESADILMPYRSAIASQYGFSTATYATQDTSYKRQDAMRYAVLALEKMAETDAEVRDGLEIIAKETSSKKQLKDIINLLKRKVIDPKSIKVAEEILGKNVLTER